MINDAGKIIDIQGNPDFASQLWHLMSKGAATYQLVGKGPSQYKGKIPGAGRRSLGRQSPLTGAMKPHCGTSEEDPLRQF